MTETFGITFVNQTIGLWPILIKLLFAAFAGGLLGFERTRKMRAAGLRTYMLVCVGSAMVMMTGQYLSLFANGSDPSRMAAQVVSGIGFLGAGTIMVTGYKRVKGLTTAAGLWAAACLGLAIGCGFYVGALLMLAVVLLSIVVGEKLQDAYLARGRRITLFVLFEHACDLKDFLVFLRANNIEVNDIETHTIGDGCINANFLLKIPEKASRQQVIEQLSNRENVAFLEEVPG